MLSDFLAVEFICLILALRRTHISSSIGCRRLDKLDRKQSNVTYVERRKMSLDNVRRQSDARCAPIWGSRPVLTSSRDSTTSPQARRVAGMLSPRDAAILEAYARECEDCARTASIESARANRRLSVDIQC